LENFASIFNQEGATKKSKASLSSQNIRKMSTTTSTSMKLKTLWCSLFQAQHTVTLKQMKHVDNYDQDSNEYRLRREKNNESVRKSRAKNRVKLHECAGSVQNLKNENIQLNKTLKSLETELYSLKGLFQHCFSFDLNNLSFKPSDIPTSTLYKIIMNKKDLKTPISVQKPAITSGEMATKGHPLMLNKRNDLATCSSAKSHMQSNTTTSNSTEVKYTETDKYFINQIKTALSNIVKNELNSAPSSPSETKMVETNSNYDLKMASITANVRLVNDHNYSLKQN
jgi:hypothetical protein